MSNELNPGDIVCFYEVINPEGNMAGMIVKESRERSLDNYVQWAQQTQLSLPPGHSFHRAMWVKIVDSKLETPFLPENIPFPISEDGSFVIHDNKYWMEHIFTIYDQEEE
jgi:hypothetical protein|tara:strand:- start:246 stop:575 length:330 start_codon:yes stop_codon:yes gene_type:complete